MAERYRVQVKVISQKGTCPNGHKVGGEYTMSKTTTEGICLFAFNFFFPTLRPHPKMRARTYFTSATHKQFPCPCRWK